VIPIQKKSLFNLKHKDIIPDLNYFSSSVFLLVVDSLFNGGDVLPNSGYKNSKNLLFNIQTF